MTKREAKRALVLNKKIARLNKREAELLASIPTNVEVDTGTLKKIVRYSPLLKRESALLGPTGEDFRKNLSGTWSSPWQRRLAVNEVTVQAA